MHEHDAHLTRALEGPARIGISGSVVIESAQADTPSSRPALPEADRQLLRRYVDLFNARDFDALRTMLAADVELDLVTRPHRRGAAVGEYFTQYGRMTGWKARPGVVEGRPAVLMQQTGREDARPDYFVLLDLSGQQVVAIQDFYYARYAIADAAPRAL